MHSRLIHPRLLQTLDRDFFPQDCAIQAPGITRDTAGGEIRSYSTVAGMESIPCRVAPAGGGERRSAQQVFLDSTHTILLAGQFRSLTTAMRAVVNGQAYDILLPEPDSEGATTRLTCRIVV